MHHHLLQLCVHHSHAFSTSCQYWHFPCAMHKHPSDAEVRTRRGRRHCQAATKTFLAPQATSKIAFPLTWTRVKREKGLPSRFMRRHCHYGCANAAGANFPFFRCANASPQVRSCCHAETAVHKACGASHLASWHCWVLASSLSSANACVQRGSPHLPSPCLLVIGPFKMPFEEG